MRITCPYCGERALEEFTYLGDASVTRPDPSAEGADEAFYAYAYERQNIAGVMRELWYHQAGCHAWLVVTRDTRTHAIHDVTTAISVAQARAGKAGEAP